MYIFHSKIKSKLPPQEYLLLLLTKTRPAWGVIPVRIAFGVVLLSHGIYHLIDSLGGIHFLPELPPEPYASIMIIAFSIFEIFGGTLMILGLFGRIIGAAIAIEILIFIAFEKLPIELSLGYEMNILLLAIAIMFALAGSGLFSIDRAIARSLLKKIPNIKHEAYVIAETPYRERWYE